MLLGRMVALALFVCLGSQARILAQPDLFEVEAFRNLAYRDDAAADPVRHKLDLYRPKGCDNYPVLFFVHGGGWVQGHKDHLFMYSLLARTLARQGIGMVSPNYRLSPGVKHPEHIRDVARAFAWTVQNVAKYGGNPKLLFVGGHSAGGHLSALLATDESYLKAEGLTLKNIKGAIPISGVYTVPNHRVLDAVFSKDPGDRRQASPISHVRENQPPFLILYGDTELPFCDRPNAQAFFLALRDKKCSAQICEIVPRNHISILWNAAVRETDPVTRDVLSFILSQAVLERLSHNPGAGIDDMAQCVARFATFASTASKPGK